jgi:hypothetical protein
MLRFFRRRRSQRPVSPGAGSVADHNPDLRIRNLLDDPALRRVMGLDVALDRAGDDDVTVLPPATVRPRLEPAAA